MMLPVRAAADAAGDATFMQIWAGRAAALSRPVAANGLPRQEDAQALLL
jgi:hypothetical protein